MSEIRETEAKRRKRHESSSRRPPPPTTFLVFDRNWGVPSEADGDTIVDETKRKISTSTNPIGLSPRRNFLPISEGITEDRPRGSSSSGEGTLLRAVRLSISLKKARWKRSARADVCPQDRLTLLSYMKPSDEGGDQTVWTCRRCHRKTNELKEDGSLNTVNLFTHVRQCHDATIVGPLGSESRDERPTSVAASKEQAYRVYHIIRDGLPDTDVRSSSSGQRNSRVDPPRRSDVGDLTAKERSALAKYLEESSTGQVTRWTCRKCNRSIDEYKDDGRPNPANMRIHVRHCYGSEAFEEMLADPPIERKPHGKPSSFGESRTSTSVKAANTEDGLTPIEPSLLQTTLIFQRFAYRPSENSSTWICKRCGSTQFTNDDGGGGGGGDDEGAAARYSNLMRHLRGCVGEKVIRQFMLREVIDDESRCGSKHESTPACRESAPERKRIFRAGDSPIWDMDVVVNAPDTPHAGYMALINAITSAKVREGEKRWEYLLMNRVSSIMNTALPPDARFLVRDPDGVFRLAAPLELREKILEIFSQHCSPTGTT